MTDDADSTYLNAFFDMMVSEINMEKGIQPYVMDFKKSKYAVDFEILDMYKIESGEILPYLLLKETLEENLVLQILKIKMKELFKKASS